MGQELLSRHRNFHQEPSEDLSLLTTVIVNVALGCFFFCSKGYLECSAVLIIDGVNALSVLKSAAVS